MALIRFEQQTQKAISNYFRRLLDSTAQEDAQRVDHILLQAGLSRESALGRDSEKISFADFKRVLYAIQDEVIPDIILRFSSAIRLSDLGILGYTVINSETIGQALEVYTRFAILSYSNFDFEVYKDKGRAVVQPTNFLSSQLEREDFIASKYNVLSRMLPPEQELGQIKVDLDYPAPAHADCYDELFRHPVNFNADQLAISFPVEWLRTPVSSADHDLYLLCEAQCAEMLSEYGEAAEIVEKVRRILLRPGSTGMQLEPAAKILMMSPRTLREHIYRAGTTYKQIVVDVRMSLARQYLLGSNMAVKEIAYLLNYSQPNAFSRAFKRTFGMTPELMRHQIR